MSNTKFIYVRDENRFPLGCFAYKFISLCKGGKETGVTLQYGYSVFNPNDKFDREHARVIAHYRLLTDPRAGYFGPTWHANNMLARVMVDTSDIEIHQWARNEVDYPQPLALRFRKACANMAMRLVTAKQAFELNREIDRLTARAPSIGEKVAS